MEARLLDYLVQEVELDSVGILMILLELLHGLDLLLHFQVNVPLAHILLDLLRDLDEAVVTLLHALLLH